MPTLDSYFVDNSENRIIYTFDGWYTTQTFENGSEYVDDIMPRKDTTLYAKWNTEIIKYITISFVTNGGAPIADIIQLENSKLILPNYLDTLLIETEEKIEEKQFEGWYIDSELTQQFESNIMPSYNLVLYAKWSVVNSAEAYTLSIYDMGEKILTRRIIAGKNIELSGTKFNTTTKYYTDSDLKTEIDIKTFIMPTCDIDLYIKNAYSIRIVSQYGNIIDETFNNKYQGENVSIIAQNSYEIDDCEDEAKRTCRTFYTFNGYYINNELITDISNYTMPNEDVEIIANWVVTVKKYVTITFNVTWVKPGMWQDNNSKLFGKIECLSAPQAPQPIKILQDTAFNPSLYNATCKYRYTGGGISKTYTFEVKSWNLESPQQLYYNGSVIKNDSYDNILTNLSVVEDTILYAVWYKV